MRRVAIVAFAVLAAVMSLTGLTFAGEKDYACKICYEPVPKDGVACETLISNTLEGVQQMVMNAAEAQQGADRMTIECSFPQSTVKGYVGYRAVIDMKK